jgi:hypothetical protein
MFVMLESLGTSAVGAYGNPIIQRQISIAGHAELVLQALLCAGDGYRKNRLGQHQWGA